MPNFSGLWTPTQQLQAVGSSIWPSLPGAPTIGTASVASGTSASVTFTAPGYTGYPAGITEYTVTSSPDGLTGTGASSPITVTGLTTGTAYTFTVKATNVTGTGPSSAASNSITPPFTYVEDVFSTTLYTGDSTPRAVTNDIPLASTAAWSTRTLLDGTTTFIYKVIKDTAGNYIVLGNSIVSGIYRLLVIKFDSSWNISWQKRVSQDSTSQTVTAAALALDPSNNIYVAFGIEGAAASLVKLNSSGDLQWARAIEPSSGSGRYLNTVIYNTVDGFLYVGGRTSGPGGPGLYAKYNTSGTVQWMYKFKPPGTYYGNQQYGQIVSMAHDSAGNVYFCGSEFDGGWKGHVVKINSSGTFQWNKRISNTTSGVSSIFIDSSDGVYVGYWDSAVFTSSSYTYTDLHTTKLNSSTGAIIWDRKIVGYPDGPAIATITGDSSGGIYTTLGKQVVKHNSSGTFQWSRRLYTGLFYGVSAIDSTLYATGSGTSNGFITELASDGSTTSGTAYHTISADVTDSAGSQTVSNGNSEVDVHTGPEQASTATLSTASTTATLYSQAAVSGFGGLVWLKSRTSTASHSLWDTIRPAYNYLVSSSTAGNASVSATDALTAFNANGFTLNGSGNSWNGSQNYASWTFREAPKFFDIVTYTGDGAASRNIAHNLGSTPGWIISKPTSTTGYWGVYHRSIVANGLYLNATNSAGVTLVPIGHTSTTFEVANGYGLDNVNGVTYVAYIFAHDAGGFGATGAENIISCGEATLSGTTTVNLGFEPQWLLMKRIDSAGGWFIFDTMRGMPVSGTTRYLYANGNDIEDIGGLNAYVTTTSTGFSAYNFLSNGNYVYVAIRKGPMKLPTDATKVFLPVVYTGNGSTNTITSGFPVDFMINKNKDSNGPDFTVMDRMRGFGPADLNDRTLYLFTNTTEVEGNASAGVTTMGNTGITLGSWGQINTNGSSFINWMFQRAPSFFDEVCWTGNNGSNQRVNHNLGVVPELIIYKGRNKVNYWRVYYGNINKYIALHLTDAEVTGSNLWGSSAPTTTDFGINCGSMDLDNFNAVAYLFATCAGVSKVGSYTGTATTLNIDCGFIAGARFVLIKRTDSTGGWYVWDSARGIVAGNDPYLLFNDDSAQVTNTDYIDPYSPGFTLSSTAPAALNASGGTYIFLAIA